MSSVPERRAAPDECVGRAVLLELRFIRAFEFRGRPVRQHLGQLDAPLIERIDITDCPFSENAVLVKRDQKPQHLRRQTLGEYGVGRAIAFENTVRREPPRRALGLDFILRLAERQQFGLREQVRIESS